MAGERDGDRFDDAKDLLKGPTSMNAMAKASRFEVARTCIFQSINKRRKTVQATTF